MIGLVDGRCRGVKTFQNVVRAGDYAVTIHGSMHNMLGC